MHGLLGQNCHWRMHLLHPALWPPCGSLSQEGHLAMHRPASVWKQGQALMGN